MQPLISLIFFLFSLNTPVVLPEATTSLPPDDFESIAKSLYEQIDFADAAMTDYHVFNKGLAGYYNLKKTHPLSDTKERLTLIDFSKSSKEKRLWVIDLKAKKVIYHSLVAHGRNTGDEYATTFSNTPNSYQSSLGFYVTGSTYIGKHGLSMKLHGTEKDINHLAEQRAIVMHGADYVSESYVKKVGRLGRSHGCPAVPMDIYKEIVNDLAGGTVLFIYYPDQSYFASSKLVKTNLKENSE
jgi:hypothetical protein